MDCTVRPFFTDAENRMVGEYRVPTFEEFVKGRDLNDPFIHVKCHNDVKGIWLNIPVDEEHISLVAIKQKDMINIIYDRDVTRDLFRIAYNCENIAKEIVDLSKHDINNLKNDPIFADRFDDGKLFLSESLLNFADLSMKYRAGKIDKCNGYYIPEPEYFVKYQYPDLSRVIFKLYHEDQSKEVIEYRLNNENCAYFEMDLTGLDTAEDPRKFIYGKIEEELNSRHQVIE